MKRSYLSVVVVLAALLAAVPVGIAAGQSSYAVEHTVQYPSTVDAGEEFTLSGEVTNREDNSLFIQVTVDGESVLAETVASGETVVFEHDLQLDQAGEHEVTIDFYVGGTHHTTKNAAIDVTETENEDGGLLDVDLVDSIKEAVFGPFNALAEAVVEVLTDVFTSYPTVQPNDAVQELHRLTLITTFALSTLTVIVAGVLFQIGPVFGVSYQQVRMMVPRILLALVFGTVSPFLLQYAVEFAEALTVAFKPSDPGFWSTTRLTGGLAVVSIINALLLVSVAALFVVRDFYILFAAAASPLIALGWALPYTRRFANSLIGVFWGFLLIGPLDMIVFRLILALLETPGNETPEWLTALGGFVMLLGVPFIVLSSGQSMVVFLGGMFHQATAKPLNTGARYVRQQAGPDDERDVNDQAQAAGDGSHRPPRHRRTEPRPGTDNKFAQDWNEGEYR